MVGEKYVRTSRRIQSSSKLSSTVTETIYTSNNEVDLKLKEYQSNLAKGVYLLS